MLEDENLEWRTSFYCEHLMESKKIPKSEGVRTEEWKYFRYVDHPEWEELYNLIDDPQETRNLASDPDSQAILEALRMQVDQFTSP